MIGRTLSHYRILEKIGSGGMGVVYRAHDERLDRDVALKVLPHGTLAGENARQRFRNEALALSRLNHPGIAAIYDFDTQQDVDFLVMEYVPGAALSEKVASGPLPEKETLQLGAQLAEALAAAHSDGVEHRDLKPGNLRVTPKGRLKILDFGLAKLVRQEANAGGAEAVTQDLALVGTLPYMAPEQLRGDPTDARSDIYAAGVVLYQMAAGRHPFSEAHGPRLLDAILNEAPAPPSSVNRRVSAALEQIILKAMDKDPRRRYQSAAELLVDLERLSVPIPPVTRPQPPPRPRHWRLALAVLGATLVAGAAYWGFAARRERTRDSAAPGRIETVAVLPLENLSGDSAQEYFTDGMTEALITDLAKLGAVRVISRNSAMRFKGTRKPIREVARELRVDAVVTGTVLRAGERVRITAQLIHADSDRHLWADSYDGDLRDILTLQADVARAIARGIQGKLAVRDTVRPGPAALPPEAHEAYLRGRHHWNRRTDEDLTKSVDYFRKAVELAPSYPAAYAGLADAYGLLGSFNVLPAQEAFPKAKEAAMKAIQMDDSLAESHTSLAWVRFRFDWDWAGAEKGFQRAMELNPSYATAHHWYADLLTSLGRHQEAMREIQQARRLDPLSVIINRDVAWHHYFARRYDEAIEQLRKTLEFERNFAPAYTLLGRAYERKGRHAEAVAALERARALSPASAVTLTMLASTYGAAGNTQAARKLLRQVQEESKKRYIPSYYLAAAHLGLGEKEQALASLEKAFQEHSDLVTLLKVDPRLDPLRSEPRFQELVRRLGL